MKLKLLISLGFACFLSSCSYMVSMSPGRIMPEENERVYKVGKPYKVDGKWYYPQHDSAYNEVGMASWYGPDFHGEDTANGEIFNKYDLTAAHKTLPMPSIAKVTNLENGRSVKVRINDRGPFVEGRIIDVSKKAADKLGFLEKGKAKVRVQYLAKETAELFPDGSKLARKAQTFQAVPVAVVQTKSLMAEAESLDPKIQQGSLRNKQKTEVKKPEPLKKKANNNQQIFVEVGSFAQKNKAENALRKISSVAKSDIKKERGVYKIFSGPYKNSKEADLIITKLNKTGFKDAFIITR